MSEEEKEAPALGPSAQYLAGPQGAKTIQNIYAKISPEQAGKLKSKLDDLNKELNFNPFDYLSGGAAKIQKVKDKNAAVVAELDAISKNTPAAAGDVSALKGQMNGLSTELIQKGLNYDYPAHAKPVFTSIEQGTAAGIAEAKQSQSAAKPVAAAVPAEPTKPVTPATTTPAKPIAAATPVPVKPIVAAAASPVPAAPAKPIAAATPAPTKPIATASPAQSAPAKPIAAATPAPVKPPITAAAASPVPAAPAKPIAAATPAPTKPIAAESPAQSAPAKPIAAATPAPVKPIAAAAATPVPAKPIAAATPAPAALEKPVAAATPAPAKPIAAATPTPVKPVAVATPAPVKPIAAATPAPDKPVAIATPVPNVPAKPVAAEAPAPAATVAIKPTPAPGTTPDKSPVAAVAVEKPLSPLPTATYAKGSREQEQEPAKPAFRPKLPAEGKALVEPVASAASRQPKDREQKTEAQANTETRQKPRETNSSRQTSHNQSHSRNGREGKEIVELEKPQSRPQDIPHNILGRVAQSFKNALNGELGQHKDEPARDLTRNQDRQVGKDLREKVDGAPKRIGRNDPDGIADKTEFKTALRNNPELGEKLKKAEVDIKHSYKTGEAPKVPQVKDNAHIHAPKGGHAH